MLATETTIAIGDELESIANELELDSAEAVLRWALREFGSAVALATGFGAEGCVLIRMLSEIDRDARIFYLDTDLLFPETYELIAKLETRYGVRFEQRTSRLSLAAQAARYGERLWEREPDVCCQLRKVEPLREILTGLRAWITAIRREQTAARAGARVVERDRKFDLIKINPLAGWSSRDVWRYIKEHDVPYNPLYDLGYRSIGCQPCTTLVQIGENDRAGRWRGVAKTECGLHQ
ncbi:MAG TPA: phosphoadenylyl-sulfate reductase [Pyrinomonadaceae bacterium]|nr:phosphoadenylyl-sulfate reductase [Pyrinomonadaceae bacterium]